MSSRRAAATKGCRSKTYWMLLPVGSVAIRRVLVCGAAALARRDELAEHPTRRCEVRRQNQHQPAALKACHARQMSGCLGFLRLPLSRRASAKGARSQPIRAISRIKWEKLFPPISRGVTDRCLALQTSSLGVTRFVTLCSESVGVTRRPRAVFSGDLLVRFGRWLGCYRGRRLVWTRFLRRSVRRRFVSYDA